MGYLQVQQEGTPQEGIEFIPLLLLTSVRLRFHVVARKLPEKRFDCPTLRPAIAFVGPIVRNFSALTATSGGRRERWQRIESLVSDRLT